MKSMKPCLRSLLLLVAAMAGLQPLLAESVEVCVWTKDGNRTTLMLSEKPRMTFTADAMSMITATTSLELPFSQLDKITYSSQSEGIAPAEEDDERQSFVIGDDGSFVFRAADTPLQVLVVSMNGMLLKHFAIGVGEWKTLPADMLLPGNYMVVVNGVTYKIAKL